MWQMRRFEREHELVILALKFKWDKHNIWLFVCQTNKELETKCQMQENA